MMIGIITAAYLAASVLFILALSGLSNQETAQRGNIYGMTGMLIAIMATVMGAEVTNYTTLIGAMLVGGGIGYVLAKRVEMTGMPELVAMLHSFVGLAAVLVGFATFLDQSHILEGTAKTIHDIEIFLGILIGAITFTGSIIAFGKLHGFVTSKPLILPAKHWLNLIMAISFIMLGTLFVGAETHDLALTYLLAMTLIAFVFGIHMVMSIGGADMPVVVSMLNSYSGWAAAATGFMLGNDLLIVVGALVGSSGAILSYIMCVAMNRKFLSVIAGGFGTKVVVSDEASEMEGEITQTSIIETVESLKNAQEVVIVPGYGMAVAQAQYPVYELSKHLKDKGVNVRFAIHPVAGRMPGHMNVLLAEAKVPYDIVLEMDEINEELSNIDVVLVIGANDIVNPDARDNPNSPIAGMPVLEVWNAASVIVMKRGMATGYAGVENPLFYKDNADMLFGDAKATIEALLKEI